MSNQIAIKVENLSKAYQLGQIGTGTISRDLERWYARMRGKEDPFLRIGESNNQNTRSESDVVWSLKDINFEIEQGDAVGIIGRNGAGKSTLLKILSKVTAPTTGKISGKGRIASLLEVGTGFHPELSGRENIFLNGAILGMRKKEIQRKLDEIVDFAGIERYLDTPVKRYSSGMYVRLAFAVAAHLESEILIVDEVLAVGDAEFQKKCLGKMGEVSKGEGRTVLFVSHNMGSIAQLCNKGLLLYDGKVAFEGEIHPCIKQYQKEISRNNINALLAEISLKDHPQKVDPNVGLQSIQIYVNSRLTSIIHSGDEVIFRIKYKLFHPLNFPEIGLAIKDTNNESIIGLNNKHLKQDVFLNKNILEGSIDILFHEFEIYGEGIYSINLYFGHIGDYYEILEDACSFKIAVADIFNSGRILDKNFNKFYSRNITIKHA